MYIKLIRYLIFFEIKPPWFIVNSVALYLSRLLPLQLAMTECRLHIIMGTSWKWQQAILSLHVIARALRPKQSSRITSFNTIIALFIFLRLFRHQPAMTECRLHIIMYTSWKCQQTILSFHFIARDLRLKQSSRINSSFWIVSSHCAVLCNSLKLHSKTLFFNRTVLI